MDKLTSFKKVKLILGTIMVFLVIIGITGCGSNKSKDGNIVLKDLKAVSGTELEAEFENEGTVSITDFSHKPLELGKPTEVSFKYEDEYYSGKVEYKVNLTGSFEETQTQTLSRSTSDISKLLMLYKNDYRILESENNTFDVELSREEPTGIAFIDKNNNFVGYLSLGDGLASLPAQAISNDTGEIDLGAISFSNNKGVPEKNPVGKEVNITKKEKMTLAAANSFFAAVVSSPDVIENFILEGKKIKFGLRYFPAHNYFETGEDQALLKKENLEIMTHRLGIAYSEDFGGWEIGDTVTIDYPDDSTTVDVEVKEEDGVGFPGVGLKERATIEGPPIPPAGKYNISGGDLQFAINIPSIEQEAKSNLVFPVPKVNLDSENRITDISWEYKTGDKTSLENPEKILNSIDIQINAVSTDNSELVGDYEFTQHSETRIYNSGNLEIEKDNSLTLENEEIYWQDVKNINMAYDDVYGIHYVVPFSREIN